MKKLPHLCPKSLKYRPWGASRLALELALQDVLFNGGFKSENKASQHFTYQEAKIARNTPKPKHMRRFLCLGSPDFSQFGCLGGYRGYIAVRCTPIDSLIELRTHPICTRTMSCYFRQKVQNWPDPVSRQVAAALRDLGCIDLGPSLIISSCSVGPFVFGVWRSSAQKGFSHFLPWPLVVGFCR